MTSQDCCQRHINSEYIIQFLSLWLLLNAAFQHLSKLALKRIKTHGSESRGQEEAGLRDEPVSYLQVAPL